MEIKRGLRSWVFIEPKPMDDGVAIAVINDKKEGKKKYVVIRPENAGLFIYSENGFLLNDEYRPYFTKLLQKVISQNLTLFVEAIKRGTEMLTRLKRAEEVGENREEKSAKRRKLRL